MINLLKSILDKLVVKLGFKFKSGPKSSISNSPNARVIQAGRDINLNRSRGEIKTPKIKIEVKTLKKYLNPTGNDDLIVILSPNPDGYYLKVNFLNQGDENTIKDILLFINKKKYKPQNFKPVKLQRADLATCELHFSEKKDQISENGDFVLEIYDIYNNRFKMTGEFPINEND